MIFKYMYTFQDDMPNTRVLVKLCHAWLKVTIVCPNWMVKWTVSLWSACCQRAEWSPSHLQTTNLLVYCFTVVLLAFKATLFLLPVEWSSPVTLRGNIWQCSILSHRKWAAKLRTRVTWSGNHRSGEFRVTKPDITAFRSADPIK